MKWPRLDPPPPMCDCFRRATLLERCIWRVRRLFKRKIRVQFTKITMPRFTHTQETLADLRVILSSGFLIKGNCQSGQTEE